MPMAHGRLGKTGRRASGRNVHRPWGGSLRLDGEAFDFHRAFS